MLNISVSFLSVQCYAWTEYKFTCVCVRHTFCQLAYRSDPVTFTLDPLNLNPSTPLALTPQP